MAKKSSISFNEFSNRGVHEEPKESLEKSFFEEIYEQAYRAVSSIITSNDKLMNKH